MWNKYTWDWLHMTTPLSFDEFFTHFPKNFNWIFINIFFNIYLQIGQLLFFFVHSRMQFLWNLCPHISFNPSIKISSRQIAHLSFLPMSKLLLWLWSLTISHIAFSHRSYSSWVWAMLVETRTDRWRKTIRS